MQPVQDLTLDNTVSRTQYQFTLESADSQALSTWTPRLVDRFARNFAELDRRGQQPGGQRTGGLRHHRPGQRGAPRHQCRHGGQCPLRRLWAAHRLHHLHAVEPVPGHFGGRSADLPLGRLAGLHLRADSSGGGQVPLSAIAKVEVREPAASSSTTWRSSPPRRFPSTWRRMHIARRCGQFDRARGEKTRPAQPASAPPSRARRSPSATTSTNELLLLLAAVLVMYIVLGVLYESFIHPITILSTLPSAGNRRPAGPDAVRRSISPSSRIIGIILLIGIVKKNAILMIDFAVVAAA